jgi:broad specificity phosphatase PhoE
MRFTLVRHGEVEDPRPGLSEIGHDDPSLTAFGRRQAATIARDLMTAMDAGEQIEALYSSPLRAARTTAEALSAVLDVGEPRVSPALTTLTPEVVPAGETVAVGAIQDQAWQLLMELKQQYEQRSTVVLVTHDLTIRALVCRALEMPLADMYRFELSPASLTVIEFRLQRDNRERTLIAALNDTCHVEELGTG